MTWFVSAELDGGTVYYDVEDSADVESYHWYVVQDGNKRYAYANTRTADGRATTIKMHRLILDAGPGERVDHIDGDGLNNRRSNLRLATGSQNKHNEGKKTYSRPVTSGYKGVHWHKPTSRWTAQIRFDGRRKTLGYFDTEEEAARAYDAAAQRYHQEFAFLNFPDETAKDPPPEGEGSS